MTWQERHDARRGNPGKLVQALIAKACQIEKCEPWEITSGRSLPHLVRTRARIARTLRNLGWTTTRIGIALGRHHTTVLYLLHNPKFAGLTMTMPILPPDPDARPFDPDQPDESGIWNI